MFASHGKRRDLLDRANRLLSRSWHLMFSQGVSMQIAREDHPYDHLLLQLVLDHMVMGVWEGGGVVKFWITPEDLRIQDWNVVTVSMESD